MFHLKRGDQDAKRVGEHASKRRRPSDATLNRAKILAAAGGWGPITAARACGPIADAARVGRTRVHRRFRTREELMDAVRRQARDDADSDEEDPFVRPAN